MLRLLIILIGNILLIPINIVLLPLRLLYKILINNKARLWLWCGGVFKVEK